jgi:hypothetical protein
MSITQTDYAVTKSDLKSLKPKEGTDRIVLRLNNGETKLMVYPLKSNNFREQLDVEPFTINVNTSVWKTCFPDKVYDCKAEDLKPLNGYVSQEDRTSPLFTIVAMLREGDEIDVKWYEASNNGYLNDSTYENQKMPSYNKLYNDEVRLSIRRPKRGREREDTWMHFNVAACVCADRSSNPDNSARILRRGYFSQ